MDSQQIADTLARLDKCLEEMFLSPGSSIDPSFSSGSAGVAMFYGYYYQLTRKEKHLENCYSLIERLLQFVSENEVPYTFCTGIAGVAWLVQHLINEKIVESDTDILDDYDSILCDAGYYQILKGNYDYLHGGLGCGIYLLDRPQNQTYIMRIVDALNQTKKYDDSGMYWLDNNVFPPAKDSRPQVNFGLAHGMPSIIFFLSKVVENNILGTNARELLRGSVDYLLSHANIDNYAGSFFPNSYIIGVNDSGVPSRLAWCYGDLGVFRSLFFASKALADKQLDKSIFKMALETTSRKTTSETNIQDGGLCHGYAGVAHIYNRFFDLTKEKAFQNASQFWINQLGNQIKEDGGIESFKEFDSIKNSSKISHGFLTGSAGIGLVLISILDEKIKPHWDRFLLLN